MDTLIDRDDLMGRFEGALDLLQDTVEIFREEAPGLLQQVQTAIESEDAEALRHAAHSYKGMIANFSAPAAVQAAYRLQEMGDSGNLEGAGETLEELRSLAARVDRELDQIIGA